MALKSNTTISCRQSLYTAFLLLCALFLWGCSKGRSAQPPAPPESRKVMQGRDLLKKGDLEGALACLGEALKEGGNPAPALALRGEAYFLKGDFARAQADLERAVQLDPADWSSLNRLGMILHRQGNFAESLKLFQAAVKANPGSAAAMDNLAYAHFYLGNNREALRYFNQALSLDPSFADSHCGKGMALARMDRKGEALAALDRAIELDGNHADAYFERGVLMADAARMKEAVEDFGRAIEARPGWVSALFERGMARYQAGEFAKAREDFEEALKQGGSMKGEGGMDIPLAGHLHLMTGFCLYETGRKDEGKAQMRQGLGLLKGEPPGKLEFDGRGYALVLLGDYGEARKILTRPEEMLHKHYALILLYRALGDAPRALSQAEAALWVLPDLLEKKKIRDLIPALKSEARPPGKAAPRQ